ncbi:MAG: hypothetical protein WBA76_03365 [Phormidesmis sp.]
MTSATFSTSLEAQQAATLMEGYRFELGHHDARQWVSLWLAFYRPSWIRDAVVEALYQGRYKSVSVRQILELWNRRGQPIRHVTYEFEAAVCREFGEVKLAPLPSAVPAVHHSIRIKEQSLSGSAHPSQSSANGSFYAQESVPADGHSKAISFDLATIPAPPGIAATPSAHAPAQTAAQPKGELKSARSDRPKRKSFDNKAWREFSAYTTPAHAASAEVLDLDAVGADEALGVLRSQPQSKGVLYASARAIQPFKPALPFSAQTLRLAKQSAMALACEAP